MKGWKILLALGIVGMFLMANFSSGMAQQISGGESGENGSYCPDYTIFTQYNYKNTWKDVAGGEAFAGSNKYNGNIVTTVWGVTGGYAGAVVGEKLYIGRNKKLNIETEITGLTGSDTWGEISLIYGSDHPGTSIFYEENVIDPLLEWDDFLDTMMVIKDAVGCSGGDLIECAELLVDAANLYNLLEQQNATNYSISFSVNAEKGERTIAIGTEVQNAGIIMPTYASAVGVVRYIKVQGYAPPPAPSITLESNDKIKSTDTPYKFKFESKDPNNDPVKYIIDWGDGTQTETDYNNTGNPAIEVTHSYSETGEYTIKAKAIDCDELESENNSLQIEILNHKPRIQSMHVYLPLTMQEIDRSKIPHWRNCVYEFGATDKDDNPLIYTIKYGDETTHESDWIHGAFWDNHAYRYSRSYTIAVNVTDGLSYNKTKFDVYVTNSLPYTPSNPFPTTGATIYVSSSINPDSTTVKSDPTQVNLQTAYLDPQASQTTYSPNQDAVQVESADAESSTTTTSASSNIAEPVASTSHELESSSATTGSISGQTALNGIDLRWSGGDPDGDNVTYKIYFGTSSPNSLIGTTENTCSYHYSGTLTAGNTYYWKVVATDEYGGVTEGPIWHFTVSNDNNNDNNSSDTQQTNNAVSQPIEKYQTLV